MERSRIQGIIVVALSAIFFLLGSAYAYTSEKIISDVHQIGPSGECIHPPDTICPIAEIHRLSTFKHLGLALDIALLLSGVFLLIFKQEPAKKVTAKRIPKDVSADEKRVLETLAQSDNFIFQNELSTQLSMTRVQITRVLDKLEAKGLIERRRRGMTNAVFLK